MSTNAPWLLYPDPLPLTSCLVCLCSAHSPSPQGPGPAPSTSVCMCRCEGSLARHLPVTLDLTCNPFTCAVSVMPTDDGCYRCTYTPDRPGFYRLEVMCKDTHLCGSPFSVQVTTPVSTLLYACCSLWALRTSVGVHPFWCFLLFSLLISFCFPFVLLFCSGTALIFILFPDTSMSRRNNGVGPLGLWQHKSSPLCDFVWKRRSLHSFASY